MPKGVEHCLQMLMENIPQLCLILPNFLLLPLSSSCHGYGHKSYQLLAEKIPDYPAIDRRPYGEQQDAYLGRDMQGDPATRYADSVGFGRQHQGKNGCQSLQFFIT